MEKDKISKEDKILIGVFIIIMVFAVIGFGFSIYKICTAFTKTEEQTTNETTTTTVELVGISLKNEQTGSFVLGVGGISGSDYYVCYKVRDDGGKELIKFKTNNTIIYEMLASGETAYAEITTGAYGFYQTVKLYVPEGTIQTEYNFGLNE